MEDYLRTTNMDMILDFFGGAIAIWRHLFQFLMDITSGDKATIRKAFVTHYEMIKPLCMSISTAAHNAIAPCQRWLTRFIHKVG
jgi:hypothetical protein